MPALPSWTSRRIKLGHLLRQLPLEAVEGGDEVVLDQGLEAGGRAEPAVDQLLDARVDPVSARAAALLEERQDPRGEVAEGLGPIHALESLRGRQAPARLCADLEPGGGLFDLRHLAVLGEFLGLAEQVARAGCPRGTPRGTRWS